MTTSVLSFERGITFSICLAIFLIVVLAPSCIATIQLDNTCTHGNNYIQFVGFPCLTNEEQERLPGSTGWKAWVSQSQYDVAGMKMANYHMNRLGINIGNVTYCSNFTVRKDTSIFVPIFGEFLLKKL
jgi:hypothetical protein